MAQVLSPPTTTGQISLPSRISARGIIAGVLVALAIELLLMAFGTAIGLSVFRPSEGAAKGAAIWAVIWFFITASASGFFGGWVASSASGLVERRDGILHGFVAWAGAAVMLAMFAIGALAGTARVAANTASNVAPSVVPQLQGQGGGTAKVPENAPSQQQLRSAAGTAANVLGMGSWGVFLSLGLSLGFSLLGGFVASGLEKRERVAIIEQRPAPPLPVA